MHQRSCQQVLAVCALFLLSFGMTLFNDGLFWDDWVIVQSSPEALSSLYSQVGAPLVGWLQSCLLSIDSMIPFLYRLLILGSYLLSSVLFFRLIEKMPSMGKTNQLLLPLMFAIFPVNASRITLNTAHYALTHVCFWLGVWLLSRAIERRFILGQLSAVLLLALSFQMNSLLIFYYPVILALLLFVHPNLLAPCPDRGKILWGLVPYLFLPVAFWLLRAWLMPPHGLYSEYNQVSAGSLLAAPVGILRTLYTSFFKVIGTALINAIQHPIVMVPASGIAFWSLWRCNERIETKPLRQSLWMIATGAILFAAAVFPYVAVGKMPSSDDWNSRHQILVPLGAALILVGSLSLLFGWLRARPWVQVLVESLLIGTFVSLNVSTCLDFQKDWFKQRSIITNLRTNDTVRDHTTFLFSDEVPEMNAQGRSYRFYEYSAFMRKAFGEDTRLGCGIGEAEKLSELSSLAKHPQYGFAHYVPSGPVIQVRILPARSALSDAEVIGVLVDCLLDRARCDEILADIVRIETSPMPG